MLSFVFSNCKWQKELVSLVEVDGYVMGAKEVMESIVWEKDSNRLLSRENINGASFNARDAGCCL